MVARILIDSSVKNMNRVYDYKVPEEMEKEASVGKRVLVNFGSGKGRKEEGIITLLQDKPSKEGMRLKKIIEILDTESVVTKEKLSLAKWMSKEYFCNVYDCLKLMFPPGTTAKFAEKEIKEKVAKVAILSRDVSTVKEEIANGKLKPKQVLVLDFLIASDGKAFVKDVLEGAGVTSSVVNTLEKHGYLEQTEEVIDEKYSSKVKINEKYLPKVLTKEQNYVYQNICSLIDSQEYANVILKGVTGSGKTEVYISLIEKVIKEGKKAIMLVPEISLTYMMAERFVTRFGDKVAILHSKMTGAERKKEWKRIKEGEISIVVGARSAIFSPIEFSDLGMVIIDEEQDLSYTSQTNPRYITEEVAKYMCNEASCILLRGSATPSVTTYYEGKEEDGILFYLNSRPNGATIPDIEIVDMKMQQVYKNRRSKIYSEEFLNALEETLDRGEQALIFLNRRGHSSYFLCDACGKKLSCPNCDVALTYHKNVNLNICHYCSHAEKVTKVCPECGSASLSMHGLGVEKLEEELERVCKKAVVLRMDADTTKVKDGHKKILDAFKEKKANCLIGTQMISKGHDIENVTLVLIVSADSMLAINDYKAAERAFSNMLQVAGRAGRSDKKGHVIVQSFDTQSEVLEALVDQDYDALYDTEIRYRQILEYPPFCNILEIDITAENVATLNVAEQRLYMYLEKLKTEQMKIFSPKSPFIQKVNNKYRSYILIKCDKVEDVHARIKFAVQKFTENEKLKVQVSVTKNPVYVG